MKNQTYKAVILAGGEGKRLRPLTEHVPKPMIEIAGRSLLEILIERLRSEKIRDIFISLGYKGELIRKCFGDGHHLGVNLKYSQEQKKLGTAGPLSLLNGNLDSTFFLINGDILTTVSFSEMGKFHQKKRADLTVGVVEYKVYIPYGVVKATNGSVRAIQEKPVLSYLVLAGIYLAEPYIVRSIPEEQELDMPDFIEQLIQEKKRIAYYVIDGEWADVGTHDDLEIARSKVKEWFFHSSQV